MSCTLPTLVNPFRLAMRRRALSGEYPLAALPRVATAVLRPAGSASLALSFAPWGEDGRGDACLLQGRLQARLYLCCQRCLAEYGHWVDTPLELALVATEAAATTLADRLTFAVEVVPPEGWDVREWVEDELLLAIPLVPRHPMAADCDRDMIAYLGNAGETTTEAVAVRAHPFAALARLRRD